jgi:hypothetical protein
LLYCTLPGASDGAYFFSAAALIFRMAASQLTVLYVLTCGAFLALALAAITLWQCDKLDAGQLSPAVLPR